MILLRIAAAVAVAFLCSCAGTRPAPRFDVPSTVPIEQAHKQVKEHGEKAQEITKDIGKECPKAAALIDKLNAEINALLTANAQGEGARIQLDEQLKQQTKKANDVARELDTVKPERDAAVAKYHKVKGWFCWIGATAVLFALLRFGDFILFFIPPPYKYIAYAALPGAAYAALWMWL